MDGHGDAQADIAGVEDRHPAQPPLFRAEREHRHGHGEGDGGVRRRPAPENPAAQPAEAEDMTDVRANAVRRMNASRERLVSGRNQRTEQRRLTDGPAGQNGSGTLDNDADTSRNSGKASGSSMPITAAGHIHERSAGLRVARNQRQIKAGHDEDDREQDGNDMPDEPPTREAAKDIARHRSPKLFHADDIKNISEKISISP